MRAEPGRVTSVPSGDPIVLLHGQPGASADWAAVRMAIGDRARLLVPDRPGWDGHRPAGGLAVNGAAVLALLDRLELPRATVVGHSFGGAVACWVAAQAPERVRALVLAAPAANRDSLVRFDHWLAVPVLGSMAAGTLLGLAGLVLSSDRARAGLAASLRVQEQYLHDAGRGLRSPRAWRSFVTEQRALLRELPELEARLGAITASTTIVIGSQDRVVPPRSASALAGQIPGARLEQLIGVGHLLPLFQPGRLAELILDAAAR